MPRTKGDVNFEDLPKEEKNELFEAIRDISLDTSAEGLRSLGVPEGDIAKARAECIATNSDAPFLELFKASPVNQQLKKLFR